MYCQKVYSNLKRIGGQKVNFNKIYKKIGVAVITFSMVASVVTPFQVSGAKAPKLNKKNVTVYVGKTATVKIKNGAKKAKVTWKVSNKKLVKLNKKTQKLAKISGVKAGKAKLTAKYVYGKVKKKLTCKVTVKDNDTTVTPEPQGATPTPSAAITENPAPTADPTAEPTEVPKEWVSTWGTAEEKCDTTANAMPQLPLADSTVRQMIKVTTSSDKMRIKLSNQYGRSDVVIKSLHVAKQVEADKSTIDTDTDTVVTVEGYEDFVIPAGQKIVTDEIDFSVEALDLVAITAYFESAPTNNVTGHRGARATTYQVAGNHVSDETFSSPKTTTSWFFLADVSLLMPQGSKAVVCFGDSITDGYGTDADYLGKKPNSYTRWGDYFAKRLQENEGTKNISVINEGIGANSMMGAYPTDAGKDRFERDLLEHDNVGYCIVLFGVNDLNKLGNTNKYNELKPEYEKMVKLAHENDIKIYAAPILPFGTSDYYSDASEQVRTMLNNWMRSEESGFDGIIDFESALADPANPKNIKYEYTKDDGLHPYEGYSVMADAIDLTMFETK